MATEATQTVPLNCPACGMHTKGLPLTVVKATDGMYQRLYCCNCKHLVYVKVA